MFYSPGNIDVNFLQTDSKIIEKNATFRRTFKEIANTYLQKIRFATNLNCFISTTIQDTLICIIQRPTLSQTEKRIELHNLAKISQKKHVKRLRKCMG